MFNLRTKIGRLRFTGLLEGVSLLVLVFIAMPMKYMYNSPEMVRAVGTIHGILFILFVLQTITASIEYRWNFLRVTLPVLFSSVIPFGTFIADYRILNKAAA